MIIQELKQRELHHAVKDIRRQLRAMSQATEGGSRQECLRESEKLYSLVFDARQLVQEGGTWTPNTEDEES